MFKSIHDLPYYLAKDFFVKTSQVFIWILRAAMRLRYYVCQNIVLF